MGRKTRCATDEDQADCLTGRWTAPVLCRAMSTGLHHPSDTGWDLLDIHPAHELPEEWLARPDRDRHRKRKSPDQEQVPRATLRAARNALNGRGRGHSQSLPATWDDLMGARWRGSRTSTIRCPLEDRVMRATNSIRPVPAIHEFSKCGFQFSRMFGHCPLATPERPSRKNGLFSGAWNRRDASPRHGGSSSPAYWFGKPRGTVR